MNFFAEHVPGVAVRAYFPVAYYITIEFAMGEHFVHVGHIGYIPPTDVAVEFAPVEHTTHVGHIGYIPLADVANKQIVIF